MGPAEVETSLSRCLRDLPRLYRYRYDEEAAALLRKNLCTALVLNNPQNLPLLFPSGHPDDPSIAWSLRAAQGATEGAEYTEAARGHPCGHIFKHGETTYHCRTCTSDATCVLCARCFANSNHEGHAVFVDTSPGNSGCCDCGDDEAWNEPLQCALHEARSGIQGEAATPTASGLSPEIVESIRCTISKALDYVCDVFSCSPEQLRQIKTEVSVTMQERMSRLSPEKYAGAETVREPIEYALVLWNDEKHTYDQVRDQVARATQKSKRHGWQKAQQIDTIGRTILEYSTEIYPLLEMARILEEIHVSVTIRSSRDTFRELMCETIISWLADISGCRVGNDAHILRRTICDEMFAPWQVQSPKPNASVGQAGIHDHESESRHWDTTGTQLPFWLPTGNPNATIVEVVAGNGNDGGTNNDAPDADDDEDEDANTADLRNTLGFLHERDRLRLLQLLNANPATVLAAGLGALVQRTPLGEDAQTTPGARQPDTITPEVMIEGSTDGVDTDAEMEDATETAGAAPPPTRAARTRSRSRSRDTEDHASEGSDDDGATVIADRSGMPDVPVTPNTKRSRNVRPEAHWLQKPKAWHGQRNVPVNENLDIRLRIDLLILYDLRLWKTLRDSLRCVYITTVVTESDYKRLLGLRFAGLYTLLAQLYLIADREPDHSVINLSVQLLTTPSITAEVVERANFLTNMIAILYTFLTSRQVGYPKDVQPNASLAFDAGVLTNRRLFTFFGNARFTFQSASVRKSFKEEPQYLRQYLDLVKLHQGICPNVRAVGEHVEYEADTWMNASMLLKEINRLSRLVAEAFLEIDPSDSNGQESARRAVRELCFGTMINALGGESNRFKLSEPKQPVRFTSVFAPTKSRSVVIPDTRVLTSAMSFHRPLHFITSWALQAVKRMDRNEIRGELLSLYDPRNVSRLPLLASTESMPQPHASDGLAALFDPCVKMCAWLSQMRAGMWVRNGMTLRHQMHNYRSPGLRDMTYQRDIFMIQAALVLVGREEEQVGEEFFVQMLHRFDLETWLRGQVQIKEDYEMSQFMDVAEDFIHLLIIVLSERDDLLPHPDLGRPSTRAVQRDIAHTLCFKPLSYSELSNRLTQRINESPDFDSILEQMTTFKGPEGLNDTGVFELKSEYFDMVEPYYAFYNRNQREEADNLYHDRQAKKLGIARVDVVPEVILPPITSGLFKELSAFTRTRSFAAVIETGLKFATAQHKELSIELAKVEPLLHLILHLILLAVNEDINIDHHANGTKSTFVDLMLDSHHGDASTSILMLLRKVLADEAYSACHPRARHIIKRAQDLRPSLFAGRNEPDMTIRGPSTPSSTVDNEAKKRAALERQAKVMASFKAQQSSFMTNQGLDWEVDDYSGDEMEAGTPMSTDIPVTENQRAYPADACILCQEGADESKLFGTFAFVTATNILRQTPVYDADYVEEVIQTPENLDRSADTQRPFGIAIHRGRALDTTPNNERSAQRLEGVLAPGFTHYDSVRKGHVLTGCGHMMHYACFETYLAATDRRHQAQISRAHPERLQKKEFLCPLCKALGNLFLPIIWKPRIESYPGVLSSPVQTDFANWLLDDLPKYEAIVQGRTQAGKNTALGDLRVVAARRHIERTFSDELGRGMLSPGLDTLLQLSLDDMDQLPAIGDMRDLAARIDGMPAMLPTIDITRSGNVRDLSARVNGMQAMIPALYLSRVYHALNVSLIINSEEPGVGSLSSPDDIARMPFNLMLQIIASTIAATEIQYRGVHSGDTLLTGISEQALTNMRIICETTKSMSAFEELHLEKSGDDYRSHELNALGHLLGLSDSKQNVRSPTPLRANVFQTLVSCAFLPNDAWTLEANHFIQLALLAEVIKTVYIYRTLPASEHPTTVPDAAEDLRFTESLHGPVDDILQQALGSSYIPMRSVPGSSLFMKRVLERQILIFLRKVAIFVHVHSGVDFVTAPNAIDPALPELDRLCALLRLPSLPLLLAYFTDQSRAGQTLRDVAARWVKNALSDIQPLGQMTLDHPGIFELVGLPRTFDALTVEAIKRRCPTKPDQPVTDPVVCLFCGAIFCSQATCCRSGKGRGGAGQHIEKCGGTIGLFINIRKCMVIHVHERHGSFAHAPFLDKHGEVDPSLRRHHQLFLNQRRYDKLLRDVWLSHGVPSAVARKLEADINNGGWETL